MLAEIFFYGYIGLMLLLALKKYIRPLHYALNTSPIGEWGMYSMPAGMIEYSAKISGEQEKDITNWSKRFLWHNFSNAEFVTICHPDIPTKPINDFAKFLAKKKEVKELGPGTLTLHLKYHVNNKVQEKNIEVQI